MDHHCHDRFMEALERLARRLKAEGQQDLPILSARLTPQTLGALIAIGGREGANLLELAAGMKITSPSASVLVRRLVAQGFVNSQIPPHNHRVVTLYLTEAGRKILHQHQSFRRKLAKKLLSPLSKQKQNELIDSLEKITCLIPTDRALDR